MERRVTRVKLLPERAAMSYRVRLLPAVSHPGHNFTENSWGAVYSACSEKRNRKRTRSSFLRPQDELFTELEAVRASNPK